MACLFVYGTLRGPDRVDALVGQRLIGRASTAPGYTAFTLIDSDKVWWPMLVEDERMANSEVVRANQPGPPVVGEIWEVDDAALRRIDAYENMAVYERRPVKLSDGSEAWAYLGRMGSEQVAAFVLSSTEQDPDGDGKMAEGEEPELNPAQPLQWTQSYTDDNAFEGTDKLGSAAGMSPTWGKLGPPPEPNRSEHPFVGTIKFRGLTIDVENDAGDVRRGKSRDGTEWETEMLLPYGEIRAQGTEGADGDKLDVYVGPDEGAPNVYIVHQNDPETGDYDEDKCLVGVSSAEEAKRLYLLHYDDPRFLRSVTEMSWDEFIRQIHESPGEKVAWAATLISRLGSARDPEVVASVCDALQIAPRHRRRIADQAIVLQRRAVPYESGTGPLVEEDRAPEVVAGSGQIDVPLDENERPDAEVYTDLSEPVR